MRCGVGASGIRVGAMGHRVVASGLRVSAGSVAEVWIGRRLEITDQSGERWIEPVRQSPDWFVIMSGDVPFQLRGAKRISQLVQRSARDFEEPGELFVLAGESLRDVAAHGVHRVFRLRVKLKIPREALSLRQLEHQDTYLIGKLPDNQVLVPFCSTHVAWAREHGAWPAEFGGN